MVEVVRMAMDEDHHQDHREMKSDHAAERDHQAHQPDQETVVSTVESHEQEGK